MNWNTHCRFAPKGIAKHCRKSNEGKKSTNASMERGKQKRSVVGKGMWGCARHCRYLEGIE